ncbi:hypothetical protein NDU88_005596 [Pleurodeles waltl]|uniref:Uncharacterized protein n=1 Tax=Pleurodeles waltl TaxID=8319 RepID=A0AAV7RK35_PLEWA|nr:hypothetical protein NDU88_005596 [Pleurodeles waltl]
MRQEAPGGLLLPWERRRAREDLRRKEAGTACWTRRYRAGRGAWACLPRGLDCAACLRPVNRPKTPGGLILEACSPEASERRQFAGPSLVGLLVLLRGAVLGRKQAARPLSSWWSIGSDGAQSDLRADLFLVLVLVARSWSPLDYGVVRLGHGFG